MKYNSTSVLGTPEVLKRKLGGEYFRTITLADGAFTNGKCVAGTVVTSAGALSTGDGSDAYGITINDCYSDNPNVAVIIAFGVINTSNTTASSDDQSALTNLYFE